MKTYHITTTEKATGKIIMVERKARTSYEALISARELINKNYGKTTDLNVEKQ
jgi:hypothetical protein